MTKQLRDQRGVAMLLEVFVALVCLIVLGFVGWRYYSHGQNTDTVSTKASTTQTTASLPTQTSNAIVQGATSESAAATGEDSSSDINSASQSVGDSYNENSF